MRGIFSFDFDGHGIPSVDNKLPRMKYSPFCKVSFFGEDKTWNAARRLTEELGHVKIHPPRLIKWMEALEMHEELKRFKEHRAEYLKAWRDEERTILDHAVVDGDNIAMEYERAASSDVAKMRPQMDGSDDAANEHGATPGFSNLLLISSAQDTTRHFMTEAKRLFTSSGEEQINVDLNEKLPIEFLVNPEIISESFRDLLPLGATSVLLGGTGTVRPNVIKSPVGPRHECQNNSFDMNTSVLGYFRITVSYHIHDKHSKVNLLRWNCPGELRFPIRNKEASTIL